MSRKVTKKERTTEVKRATKLQDLPPKKAKQKAVTGGKVGDPIGGVDVGLGPKGRP